ncbi:hypothetical protein SERLADRAFT_406633 [Serpula lacrymans var. lacrymans S7.9]|uniref:Amidohydrolase-related domain-containing protein n=1 Tax=Serpula lacrymans var. lacrymans (strain S7.9) TaxID=578457 RepID=F8NNF0_SERL9|nr:uncharacterized protein SERLADRAFT_406633 [Serpula lacrymans var. lacrymans S7.9]EGO27580.1 hypothetical protein SERLADRAFT_406633 [Serpula lacrymans var. lacrymans S7.9]
MDKNIRIDVHHHFFLDAKQKKKRNGEIGWRTPEENLPWHPTLSLKAMDALGIQTAILSPPPLSSGAIGSENRAFARTHNSYAAKLCNVYPERFGFFACLPTLNDVEGALSEICHALDHLKADGIALISSYGEGIHAKYIGDDSYDPIWKELDRRQAVVFLHGAQTPSSTPYPHDFLGLPISEVPNETFKAAAHLVVTGRKRKYPNVKIILAHLGGSTPFLAARVAILSKHMGCTLTPEEILQDFKSFYYETALGAHEVTLTAMEKFVPLDHILFGTDFPAVSIEMASWYTDNLENFYNGDARKLDAVTRRNALNLLPRLRLQ